MDEDRSPTPPHNSAFDDEEERKVWSAAAKGMETLQKSSHSTFSKRSKSGKRSANSRSGHSRKSTGKLRVAIDREGFDSKMQSSHSPTQFTAIDEYWNSPDGKKSIGLIPKMALPLDLRPLRADYKVAESDNVFADDDGSYPAGSAVNAVRKSYSNSEQ